MRWVTGSFEAEQCEVGQVADVQGVVYEHSRGLMEEVSIRGPGLLACPSMLTLSPLSVFKNGTRCGTCKSISLLSRLFSSFSTAHHGSSCLTVLWDIGEYRINAAQDAEHSDSEGEGDTDDPWVLSDLYRVRGITKSSLSYISVRRNSLGEHEEAKLRHALYGRRKKGDEREGGGKRAVYLTLR